MKKIIKIALFTIQDELHHKSFYILTGVSILFVMTLRGCFKSDMVVNGQHMDAASIGWHVSIIAFQMISWGAMLLGILLAMRSFRHDSENGSMVFLLSKPISRVSYVAGKTVGLWALSFVFMFLLHLTVYIIMIANTGGRMPWYLIASGISSLSLFFVIAAVLILSLVLPDVIAVFAVIVIGIVSLFSDSMYALLQSSMAKAMIQGATDHQYPIWQILWPKISGLQYYCTSLIQESPFQSLGPLHPALNLFLYAAICTGLLFWKFSKEEIR